MKYEQRVIALRDEEIQDLKNKLDELRACAQAAVNEVQDYAAELSRSLRMTRLHITDLQRELQKALDEKTVADRHAEEAHQEISRLRREVRNLQLEPEGEKFYRITLTL